MFTSQAEADAKNAANKEKAEAAKAKAESSFAAAEAAESSPPMRATRMPD